MARLHYNLVRTALDGAIDDTVTTFAITAPLREGGNLGSFIPTVASPDVLAIRVDDEIMHVTDYTSGSTTITTVARGQDDTVADSHADAAVVKHVIAKADLVSGGGGNLELLAVKRPTDGATATITGGTWQAFSTAWSQSITLAATRDVIIDVTANWKLTVDTITHWALFRDGTLIESTGEHYGGDGSRSQTAMFQFVDEAVAAGTYTYEIRIGCWTNATATIYNATGSPSLTPATVKGRSVATFFAS